MTAFNKRVIKSNLVLALERKGFKVMATDSASITVFTDKPINRRSKKIGNYSHPYLTSFGEKGALNLIATMEN